MWENAPLRFAALRFGFDEHVHLTRSSSLCSSSHLSLGFGTRGFDIIIIIAAMWGDAPLRFAALRFGFDEHVHLTRSSSLCSSSHLCLGFGSKGFDIIIIIAAMWGDAPLRFAALRFGFDEHVHLTRSSSLCSSSHLSLGFGARGFDGVG
ncbi:hypothetical protein JYU34_004951 [Plutella xylostella]|uniref:Uncharacterized protein n=1 Tax=Plutella xylostella TaxID=51655 RepID=A0ABQ7QVK3_PLUXY|nr:hypothetical protein JYU34_004951 [Plutella xylostella]